MRTIIYTLSHYYKMREQYKCKSLFADVFKFALLEENCIFIRDE